MKVKWEYSCRLMVRWIISNKSSEFNGIDVKKDVSVTH